MTIAEHDREEHTERGAGTGEPRPVGLLERGEHEHRGLETLTEHREERHDHETDRRAPNERDLGTGLEVPLQVGRVPAHPHDHPRDHPDGDQGDDRFELLLLLLREVLLGDAQRNRRPRAEQDRSPDAEPHPPERVAPATLDEERGDDPDDQRCFEAFPEPDDEGREHLPMVRLSLLRRQGGLGGSGRSGQGAGSGSRVSEPA